MKIGIMTFPNSTSYGAVLQMYGLYRGVEQLGAEAEIINYHNSFMKAERHTAAVQRSGALRLWARHVMHARQFRGFRKFEKTMKLYPCKPIVDPAALRALDQRYDGVICGSDQVWNPNITDSDLSFFLDFCGDNTKRIAYAPSFGIREFSEDFRGRIKGDLNKFHSLCAREQEGKLLLEQLTGRQVPLVLDPTFLLTEQDWTALEQKHPAAQGEYILYYTVFSSESLLRFCLELAEKENKKIVFIGGNPIKQLCNKNKRIRYACDVTPGQWLYLMHRASCVVTNSFHGTAFSIHYKKNFFLELSSNTNSRLEQIIRTTGLENRVVGPDCADGSAPVDYSQVQELLAPAKAVSVEYLKGAICRKTEPTEQN